MDKSVNERLTQARHELKLSQVKFSKGIHLSSGYYGDIEAGRIGVNDRIIELVSSVYGINKLWLKTGEGNMFDNQIDPKFEEMSVLFNQLNPDFQSYVLTQIKNLIKLQDISIPR